MVSLWGLALLAQATPTLWIIGDSTVRNGNGTGQNGQWGWGDVIAAHFDPAKIKVVNRAIGGRSSRTFTTDGRWNEIEKDLHAGDFVLIQFGHNDPGAINDETRARGTIRGIGEETQEIENLLTKKHETVHSFGWYVRRFIQGAKAHGAEAIVCSYIPRCPRPGAKVALETSPTSYRLWARQVAEQEKAPFVDLFALSMTAFLDLSPEEIKRRYYCEADFTHTNRDGAELNANCVVARIRALKGDRLNDYLVEAKR